MKKIWKNLFYLFLPIVIGSMVGLIIKNFINYQEIVKPPLAPPKILFPIAWTIIYLLMGLAYMLLHQEKIPKIAKVLYYSQLFVNALWSIIFFIFHNYFLSFIWILLLDYLVFMMIYQFYKIKKGAAYLNILYVGWIIFATYLTGAIWLLN